MGTKYLTDSNAVIEFLGGMLPSSASKRMQEIVDLNSHRLSVINQIELLGFNAPDAEMQTLEAFVASSMVLPLSDSVVEKTIELRKMYKIKLPDAIIAATALVHNLKIITRNTSDFEKIQGVDVIHSHDL
jgi:predicted nucleic acid-binding protein